MTAPKGFVRKSDGILRRIVDWHDRSYTAPDEAIMTMYAGKERLGCNERVFANYGAYPCGNPAKHDPDHNGNPTKCGHHSAARKAAKKAKADAKEQAWRNQYERQKDFGLVKDEMLPLIEAIAAGHNDPRSVCTDWLARYNDAKARVET